VSSVKKIKLMQVVHKIIYIISNDSNYRAMSNERACNYKINRIQKYKISCVMIGIIWHF
jgi:hypothetical protein